MSLDFLVELAIRSTLLFALAWLAVIALGRSSAAVRHQVWTAALLTALLLPALVRLLPDWRASLVTTVTPVWVEPVVGGTPAALQWGSPPAGAARSVPAVAAAGSSTTFPMRPKDLAPWIWLAGCALMLVRLAAGLFTLRRLSKQARPLTLPTLEPSGLTLLESASPSTMPITWGTHRPRILLPSGAAGWPEDRLRLVVAHELAHVARRDWLVQVAAELARAVYWFHPLVWVAASRLREEGERACDDVVLRSGADAPAYADHLVHLARILENPVRGGVAALAIARASNFERRVKAMLHASLNRRPVAVWGSLATAAIALAALIPLAALAPGQEIRGVVTEPGTNHPIEDANVTIRKLPSRAGGFVVMSPATVPVIGTATTNAQGEFRFEPPEFGEYRVTVQKEGYTSTGGLFRPTTQANVSLTAERPAREVQLMLGRMGEVSGRIVDADTGEPTTNVRVSPDPMFYNRAVRVPFRGRPATTDAEGRFRATGVSPGDYVLSVQSFGSGSNRFVEEISTAEIDKVDVGYEPGYFPGGPALDDALPFPVSSGATVDVGTIGVRKVGYHRVLVTVSEASCPQHATISIQAYAVGQNGASRIDVPAAASREIPCGGQVLMRNLPPGFYRVHAHAEGPVETRVSADVPFEIADENLMSIELTLTHGFLIEGRVVLADGAAEVPLEDLSVSARALGRIPFFIPPVLPDAKGRFRLENRQPGRWQVTVAGLPAGAYIKEMRYRGVVQPGTLFDFTGDGALEIEIDTHPAVLSGKVTDRDRPVEAANVVLVRWPLDPDDAFNSLTHATTNADGAFQTTLPPGEYRVFALAQETKDRLNEPGVLQRLLARAERLELDRGSAQNLPLRVLDPAH